MSQYLWPLGSNYNNEYMDTDDFLKNCRKVTKNQYYNTVQWRCQPGYVPFNYITNYYPISGIAQEITASGVFTETGVTLNPFFHGFDFPDEYINTFGPSRRLSNTGEGVRLTKLYYRINDGKWMELSPSLKNVSFDLSSNDDKVEIKATYQVWTMGNPHSPIPFMWLGNEDGLYNSGKNNFTDAVPVNPGRKYSGIMNNNKSIDHNADWKLQSVSWYAPGSTMLESNWSYQNAMGFRNEAYKKIGMYLNTWSGTQNCQVFNDSYMDKAPGFYEYVYQYGWKYNYPNFNTNDKTSGWWRSTYKTRKSMWWVYERTFTDTYVASGIEQQQTNATVKNATLKVVQDDRTSTFNRGSRWLNGTTGKLLIDFTGPSLAFVDVYAVQKIYNEEMVTKIISGEAITSGITNTIEITFSDYPQLYRSKDIAYYMEIFTVSGGFASYEYKPTDTSYTGLLANGVHYYNDEPPWISNVKIRKVDTYSSLPDPLPVGYRDLDREDLEQFINKKELYHITWDGPKDPDGHPVEYSFLIDEGDCKDINFSTAEDYSLSLGRQNDWTLRFRRGTNEGSNENTTLLNADKATITMTNSNSALYTLPVDRLLKDSQGNFIDPLNIWIVPHDGRTNNYYYGTRVNLLHTEYDPVTLEVVEDVSEDKAAIKILHSDFINAVVNIKVYAFMSTHPHDDSTGRYLGIVYEGPIDPGYTTKTINLYDKINGEQKYKRGHYIKYAISCKDLNQLFDPYAEDAWDNAIGFHKFNCLPSAATPFLCEPVSTVFNDKIARIAWNESIDEDGDKSINYHLYIASINKPELNTRSRGFWINDEKDINYETRRYYKVVNVGTTLPTKDMPYKLELPEFKKGDIIQIWITAKDNNNSTKYLTGYPLLIGDDEAKANKPQIKVFEAKAYNLLEKEQTDGESGYVKVYQSNKSGEDATVFLHAICKKIDGPNAGDMKLFNNVATWNLKSGEWSPDTKIIFKSAFGEEWSNSYVRYYAVSVTISGVTSYDGDYMTVSAFDKWDGEHIYNEQPTPFIIRSGDNTDLHSNIHVAWGYLIDEDFRSLDNVILIDGAYDPSAPKVFH